MRIDEITRRDLLKGIGATALAGTLSSQAKGFGSSISLVGDVDKQNNTYAGVPVEDLSWQLDVSSKLRNKKAKPQRHCGELSHSVIYRNDRAHHAGHLKYRRELLLSLGQ